MKSKMRFRRTCVLAMLFSLVMIPGVPGPSRLGFAFVGLSYLMAVRSPKETEKLLPFALVAGLAVLIGFSAEPGFLVGRVESAAAKGMINTLFAWVMVLFVIPALLAMYMVEGGLAEMVKPQCKQKRKRLVSAGAPVERDVRSLYPELIPAVQRRALKRAG